ncbi:hypothetical protein MKZ38_001993 [Zalerion maritima]|uniref:Pt repeat family protein n=1 Tax=Zalerion maritima TaxID=339359 RepID=A0AAD5RQ80_9PEZI|nr:hypothetical protein MKZ38_001993 [Zalerion maritima]
MSWDASAVPRGRSDGLGSPFLGARTFSSTGSHRQKGYADINSYTLSPSPGFENSVPQHGGSQSQFFGPQPPQTPFSPISPASPSFSSLDSPRPSTMMTMMMGSGRVEPAMGVKAYFWFEDPVRAQYNRSYTSSTNFEPNDKILRGLARRIDHCSRELITRKDFTALEDIREYNGTLKPLRYEVTFQIYLRGSGVWTEKSYRSFQKNPLNMENAKEVILSAHRTIGLFLRRHDKDFIWVDGPIKEQLSMGPELSQPLIGFPAPLTCIPRSRFIETTQSFESLPGYTVELLLSSRWRRRQPMPWEKLIRVNSRQCTPLNLPTAEQIFWKLARRVDEAIETRKMVFEEMHKFCDGLDGTYQCHHYEENAFEMMVSISNHLGPAFTHLRRNFRTDMILFPDPENNDCEAFLDALKPVFAESRNNADRMLDNLNDLELRVVELRGRGWAVERPLTLTLGSSGSYSRRSVEAILERVETAIYHILTGNDVICRITAHKRGHLILDKTLLAQRERGIFRRDIPNPEVEKQAFVDRLENQTYDELAMVCLDTCSLQDFPDFDVKVAHPATDPVDEAKARPGTTPQQSTQAPAADRTVKLAPAVSHAVRRGSDAASSAGSDGVSGEDEPVEDTVHNKYRWGKLVPSDRDSIHTDTDTNSGTREVPENETPHLPEKKTPTTPRYNLFPSDSVPKLASASVRTSGDSAPAPKTPELPSKNLPLSVPIQQPEKEQDSNIASRAAEDPSPETILDDSNPSTSSESRTSPSEVEIQDEIPPAESTAPVADALFPAPREPQIETPTQDGQSFMERTDSKASVHSRPSTKHADSIPSTPSLDMSSPSRNSPRNSLLITPQYFPHAGGAGKFFEVQGDSSDDGRPSIDLPESPTLGTKRHGDMFRIANAIVSKPTFHDAHVAPSPVESHSSGLNDLNSLSSSQKTIQATAASNPEPSNSEIEITEDTNVGSIGDNERVAEPELPAFVSAEPEPEPEVHRPVGHGREEPSSDATILDESVESTPSHSEPHPGSNLSLGGQDPANVRRTANTIDVLFDEVEKLGFPAIAPTPDVESEITAKDGPASVKFCDIPKLSSSSSVSETRAIHESLGADVSDTSWQEPTNFTQRDLQTPNEQISTRADDVEIKLTPTSTPSHDESHHGDHLQFPEYDFLHKPKEEQRVSIPEFPNTPSSSGLAEADPTTLDDPPTNTNASYSECEPTPAPTAELDTVEGDTAHDPPQIVLLEENSQNNSLEHHDTKGVLADLNAEELIAPPEPPIECTEGPVDTDSLTIAPDPVGVFSEDTSVKSNSVRDNGSSSPLAHAEEEPSYNAVVPLDPQLTNASVNRDSNSLEDGETQDEFEDDGALIAHLEELSRNVEVGFRDRSPPRGLNTASVPLQPSNDLENPPNASVILGHEKQASMDPGTKADATTSEVEQPENPILEVALPNITKHHESEESIVPLDKGLLVAEDAEVTEHCIADAPIMQTKPPIPKLAALPDVEVAANVPIPNIDENDVDLDEEPIPCTTETTEQSVPTHPKATEAPKDFGEEIKLPSTATTAKSEPNSKVFSQTENIFRAPEAELTASTSDVEQPTGKKIDTVFDGPTAEAYPGSSIEITSQAPDSSESVQELDDTEVPKIKYGVDGSQQEEERIPEAGQLTTEGKHSFSLVTEAFPDLVISPVRSRTGGLSINTSHSHLPSEADDEELTTPKATNQDYFTMPPPSPDPFPDSVAGTSRPLRRKASSLYSTNGPRSSISTFLSVTTDHEPKTSYERLSIKDLPVAPRSPFFPASAGYVGLHEEKRVEFGLRNALMGPFRRVSGHVSSRPSTSGTMTPGGEKGKDKEKRRIRWGRERRRGKSVDIASLAKFTGPSGGKKLTKKNPVVGGEEDVPGVPAIPPEHMQQQYHEQRGSNSPAACDSDRPRSSFASSRKSKGVPVTAHPVKTTEQSEGGNPLPRLMIIFAGVTIAGKMLVGPGGP